MSDSTHGAKSATVDEDSEQDEIASLPGSRVSEWSEPVVSFVDTPMDNHTRTECPARVRGWADHEYASVSVEIDIDATGPLSVSFGAEAARQLATELLAAAVRAEEYAAGWDDE